MATRCARRHIALGFSLIPALLAAPNARGDTLDLAAAQRVTDAVRPRVEALRGRKFLRPVPVRVVTAQQARDHFRTRLEKFWPAERRAVEEKAYAQLGLLPKGVDLAAAVMDLLEEQAAAYYDPDADAFFILDRMPALAAPMIVAHELTHALDDQHFAIDSLLAKAQDDDDRSTALNAVVEGSGTLVMSAFLVEEMKAGRMDVGALAEFQKTEAAKAEKFTKTPGVLQRSLLGPYVLGQSFLLHGDPARLAQPIRAEDVDRAFQEPPVSSEQILHPEKYWEAARRDVPRAVALPDLSRTLGAGWRLAGSGTLGEMVLAVLAGAPALDLASPTLLDSRGWTNAASSGSDGDRYQLYVKGSASVTVLATRWDTPADAGEFAAALARSASLRVLREGDVVVVWAGGDDTAGTALAQAVLKAASTR